MGSKFKNRIIELRSAGLTFKAISEELGCAMSTVSFHCTENSVPSSVVTKQVTQDDSKKIQSEYDRLKSTRKVSKLLGWSRDTVRKHVDTLAEKRIKTGGQRVVEWRKRAKQKLVDYKGGNCVCCGYSKCIDALHFHHLDPATKKFRIGGSSKSLETLMKEADKCILVCGNCHTEIHAGLIDLNDIAPLP